MKIQRRVPKTAGVAQPGGWCAEDCGLLSNRATNPPVAIAEPFLALRACSCKPGKFWANLHDRLFNLSKMYSGLFQTNKTTFSSGQQCILLKNDISLTARAGLMIQV